MITARNISPLIKMYGRIDYIDFLKLIGLTCIILAHVSPPNLIFSIRNFDVPFMVILSSILGNKSFKRSCGEGKSILEYYIKRIKRLVFPTWIFLVIYFTFEYCVSMGRHSFEYYMYSFLLTRYGIGYVWVILIYLYSALFVPLYNKINLSKIGMICVAVAYIVYECMLCFEIGIDNRFIETTLYYMVPYGVLTYFGCNYYCFEKKQRFVISSVSILIFIILGIYYWGYFGIPQPVQLAKYPPRLYYLGYGVGISYLLLLLCENINLKIYDNIIVKTISKNSLWIYLWYIMYLKCYTYFNLPDLWYMKFIMIYTLSVLTTIVVNKIIDTIEIKKSFKIFKYLRG